MLVLAAGLIMTLSLIGFSMYTFREGQRIGNEMTRNLSDMVREEEEYKYLKFEEGNITGGEVVRALGAYQDKVMITVVNGASKTSYKGSFKGEDNKPGKETYIALSATYSGRVRRDPKGMIYEIVFTRI